MCSAISHYVFSEKLANWHSGLETVHIFAFLGVLGNWIVMLKSLVFVLKTQKHPTEPNVPMDRFRNKTDQTFFIENVARNGLKSHFLGPNSAPFCCKNANLPNRTCFTRIRGRGWGGWGVSWGPAKELASQCASFETTL